MKLIFQRLPHLFSMTGKLVIMMDETKLEEMMDEAKKMGFRNVGDFVMGCVRCAKESRNFAKTQDMMACSVV